jgi:c-di-GMP-binding flagellar brake protein YcgR
MVAGEEGREVEVAAFESEKREFTRVRVTVPVRYKFLCNDMDHPDLTKVHEGTTRDLSGGGLLLRGRIPQLEWLPTLLAGKMKVGVNLILPTFDLPVKALTRVSWVEGMEEETLKADMGLRFREITKEAQDEIVRYIIKTQMP